MSINDYPKKENIKKYTERKARELKAANYFTLLKLYQSDLLSTKKEISIFKDLEKTANELGWNLPSDVIWKSKCNNDLLKTEIN